MEVVKSNFQIESHDGHLLKTAFIYASTFGHALAGLAKFTQDNPGWKLRDFHVVTVMISSPLSPNPIPGGGIVCTLEPSGQTESLTEIDLS